MLISRMLVKRCEITAAAILSEDSVAGRVVAGTAVTSDIHSGFRAVRHPPRLDRPFSQFDSDQQLPAFTVADGELVAYGWLCTPISSRPSHMPRNAGGKYWIHYCGTVPAWRGRGLYKQTLRELCRLAWKHSEEEATTVHIDVRPDNAQAVAATVSVGFLPDGDVWVIQIPRLGHYGLRWQPMQGEGDVE